MATRKEKNELDSRGIKFLTALHLTGGAQKSLSGLNLQERRNVVKTLIDKGYLTNSCQLTPKGINAAAPKF